MNRQPQTTAFWSDRLPHWEVEEGRYFITIHLASAIPKQGQQRIRAISDQLRNHTSQQSPDWLRLQRMVFAEMERWLDQAGDAAHLQRKDVAEMIVEAITNRVHRGYWHVFEYVVMPNHLHLFCEIGAKGLKGTLEDFKRWTGHSAAKILCTKWSRFWQREWFDHWSRSDEEDERIMAYIRNNPVKAGLVARYEDWRYGSWNK